MGRHNNPNISVGGKPYYIQALMIAGLKGKALKAYENDPEKKRMIEEMLTEKSIIFARDVSEELNKMFD